MKQMSNDALLRSANQPTVGYISLYVIKIVPCCCCCSYVDNRGNIYAGIICIGVGGLVKTSWVK